MMTMIPVALGIIVIYGTFDTGKLVKKKKHESKPVFILSILPHAYEARVFV